MIKVIKINLFILNIFIYYADIIIFLLAYSFLDIPIFSANIISFLVALMINNLLGTKSVFQKNSRFKSNIEKVLVLSSSSIGVIINTVFIEILFSFLVPLYQSKLNFNREISLPTSYDMGNIHGILSNIH